MVTVPESGRSGRKAKITRELIIVLFLSVAVYVVASYYNILERILVFTNRHEQWQLDEIITTAIFLVFALAVFAFRRWRDVVVSEKKLELQNNDLQQALDEIHQLKGIIPICASCKKIRDDEGYWHQVEIYISDHSEAEFSHGICPDCMKKLYPQYVKNDSGEQNNPN